MCFHHPTSRNPVAAIPAKPGSNLVCSGFCRNDPAQPCTNGGTYKSFAAIALNACMNIQKFEIFDFGFEIFDFGLNKQTQKKRHQTSAPTWAV
jgi:hypothetical protein